MANYQEKLYAIVQNLGLVACKKCGHYHHIGYICYECGHDNSLPEKEEN